MYDFKAVEYKILNFWNSKKIYEKSKQKTKGKKKFYFLQGPPYTSGRLHIGHAWNHALKDQILRYKRMQGFDVWDRGGFDMHGLPTAHKVQDKFDLKTKDDIEAFGIDKFITECKKFSSEMANLMNEDLKKFGVWMDHDNAYMPIKNEFMEGEWFLIKKAYENNRLYQGEKSMQWCYSCETALAKHELEYESVTDISTYVKLKVRDIYNEYLIIWTTTPWTIPFNLGVMAHPEFEYAKVKAGEEIWIIAKDLVEPLNKLVDKDLKIIETFPGSKLAHLKYDHPFHGILKEHYDKIEQQHPHAFTVVLSDEFVDLSAGTGLVHLAPGCGPEDYEVGRLNNIPPFNTLNEQGYYAEDMNEFSGLHAKKDNKKFIDYLDNENALIATTKVKHDYAHCWRCKNPIIYKTTKQWFLKIEDVVPEMITESQKMHWVPKEVQNHYEAWIANLRDNTITRQRYWGTPVPIWQCDQCKDISVIGSTKELNELSGVVPKDLHRPWIDEITIPCKCGHKKHRIPDIIDVWIDSSVTSWTCLDYPHRTDLFEKLWPADLVLEGTEHTRLWYYMLHLGSKIVFNKPAFKNIYSHGMLRGIGGVKMSKSLGNIISPYEVIDKHGIDTLRYYMSTFTAGEDPSFSWDEAKQKQRNLVVLSNTARYVLNYQASGSKNLQIEDKYILSKLNSTLQKVTSLMEHYRLDETPLLVEDLFLELSRVYIQIIRDRKQDIAVKDTMFDVLFNCLKMFSITCPFLTEHLYQQIKDKFNLKEESIHLYEWPAPDNKLIDETLEKEFEDLKKILQELLSKRNDAKIGIRWPLQQALVTCKNSKNFEKFSKIIKKQVNVKEVEFKEGALTVELETKITPELEKEGFFREVTRFIQSQRKKENLKPSDKINLNLSSSYDISSFEKEIKNRCGIKDLTFNSKELKIQSDFKVKDQEFKVSFEKL